MTSCTSIKVLREVLAPYSMHCSVSLSRYTLRKRRLGADLLAAHGLSLQHSQLAALPRRAASAGGSMLIDYGSWLDSIPQEKKVLPQSKEVQSSSPAQLEAMCWRNTIPRTILPLCCSSWQKGTRGGHTEGWAQLTGSPLPARLPRACSKFSTEAGTPSTRAH